MKTLFTWLGDADLTAFKNNSPNDAPLSKMLLTDKFSTVVVISDWQKESGPNVSRTKDNIRSYADWLSKLSNAKVELQFEKIKNPIDLEVIFPASFKLVSQHSSDLLAPTEFTFNLSSGTWAMAYVWSLIAKASQFNGRLWASSKEAGVAEVKIPFELDFEFLAPSLKKEIATERGIAFDTVLLKNNAYYSDVTFMSGSMKKLRVDAIVASDHSLPVFIKGAVGTEKSVLARFIHENDPDNTGKFIPVFCGRDSSREIESKLFGEQDSRFQRGRSGKIETSTFVEKALKGTLYLEEVETLSAVAQSLLLELIENFEAAKLQNPKARPDLPRIMASSKNDLFEAVLSGSFSEQLFFKLSASTIAIPSLSERGDDILKIADSMLKNMNRLRSYDVGYSEKHFSPAALSFIKNKKWRGNLMELDATVRRAALTAQRDTITEQDIFDASIILPEKNESAGPTLNMELGENFDLEAEMKKMAKHYLERAMEQSGGNRAKASKLVGISNYQTFTNWLVRYVKNAEDPDGRDIK